MIQLRGVSLRVPGFDLRDVSFAVPEGAYATMMGATGSGKTSILEAVCGLRRLTAGTITINNRDITRLKPGDRGIGYVPQDIALFPTMRVRDHLAFPMTLRRWDKPRQTKRIDELAELLGIGQLLKRRPHGLSGGERQRVALGRALAFGPAVLLLDEPLSALDESTRARLIDLLKRVQAHEGVTTLHVTHSSVEAEALGTHHFQLRDGRLTERRSASITS